MLLLLALLLQMEGLYVFPSSSWCWRCSHFGCEDTTVRGNFNILCNEYIFFNVTFQVHVIAFLNIWHEKNRYPSEHNKVRPIVWVPVLVWKQRLGLCVKMNQKAHRCQDIYMYTYKGEHVGVMLLSSRFKTGCSPLPTPYTTVHAVWRTP